MSPFLPRTFVAALLSIPLIAGIQTAQAAAPLLITTADFAQLRNEPARWQSMLPRCDSLLDKTPSPVEEFKVVPHYGKEGVNHDPVADAQYQALRDDSSAAYQLGLCYMLTSDAPNRERYATKVQEIAGAWGSTLRKLTKGQDAHEINFFFQPQIIAASWVRDVGHWDDRAFRDFLKRVVMPVTNTIQQGNHADWQLYQRATIFAYLGEQEALQNASRRWQEQLLQDISEDGSMPLEICRSNTSNYCGGATKGIRGLAYTHWALKPMTASAEIFRSQGIDVYRTTAGDQLNLAFNRAASWTLRPETFPYYASNGNKLEDINGFAYFPLLLRHYKNTDAQTVLEQKKGDDFMKWMTLFGPEKPVLQH